MIVKYVMRRGKSIVQEAFVATGNEENEYGRATPVRTMPFTSSSSDVLQAAIRCNADYQYQKRCVPDVDLSDRLENVGPAAESLSFMVHVLRGARTVLAGAIAITLATAMRAANVADFYMTKYQCKPQEKLGSILQPFLAGMRRIDAEEAKETGGQQRPIAELARRRVRRFIFSANRTMWFSACELATFLMTGDTAVKTEGQ